VVEGEQGPDPPHRQAETKGGPLATATQPLQDPACLPGSLVDRHRCCSTQYPCLLPLLLVLLLLLLPNQPLLQQLLVLLLHTGLSCCCLSCPPPPAGPPPPPPTFFLRPAGATTSSASPLSRLVASTRSASQSTCRLGGC
jgi:hypothetical protein